MYLSYRKTVLLDLACSSNHTEQGNEREGLEWEELKREDVKGLFFELIQSRKHLDFREPSAVALLNYERSYNTFAKFFQTARDFSRIFSLSQNPKPTSAYTI
jgi:hypothetical protein